MSDPAASVASPSVRPADSCVMVICGAGGDLTKRKLLPALCNLAGAGLLSKQFAIVGFSRGARSDDEFRRQLTQDIQGYDTVWVLQGRGVVITAVHGIPLTSHETVHPCHMVRGPAGGSGSG